MIERPADSEYHPFYAGYLELVTETDLLAVLRAQPDELSALVGSVADETHRYTKDKWNIREVLGHMADVERVFGYRALCISRLEETALPGFDENDYIASSTYAEAPAAGIVSEFTSLRAANLAMFERLPASRWEQLGNANGSFVSVRALAFILAGHFRHHVGILRHRYKVAMPA